MQRAAQHWGRRGAAMVRGTSSRSRRALATASSSANYDLLVRDESDTRFPSYQQGFNMRWVGNNVEQVYLVKTAEGAAEAFEEAISKYGAGAVRIQSGGHCYENFVFDDDTKAVLNMSNLLDWGHDEEKGYYLSSGDSNWGAFKKIYSNWGAVIPGGSCYSVGLGGHICGGGDGIMSRKYGIAADWLTGVELVVKDDANSSARLIYVGEDSTGDEYDLYWAHTGGGGGNFGVITKYYFKKLPPAPQGVIVSNISFDWTKLTEKRLFDVLNWYFVRFGVRDDNRDSSAKFQIMHRAVGEFQLYVQTAYWDDDGKTAARIYHGEIEAELEEKHGHLMCVGTKALAGHGSWYHVPKRDKMSVKAHIPCPKTGELVRVAGTDYNFYASTQTINGSGPNQRGKYKSAYHKGAFDEQMVKDMFQALSTWPEGAKDSDLSDTLIQIDCFGGAINDRDSTATAIPQRSYIFKLQYQTYWQDEDDDEMHLSWIRDTYNTVYSRWGGVPDPSSGIFEGCYYNYPDVDLNKWKKGKWGALSLYFLDNFQNNPRNLVDIKKRWDPNEYFKFAQSIPTHKVPLDID